MVQIFFDFPFPEPKDGIAHFLEFLVDLLIPLDIAFYLGNPKFPVCLYLWFSFLPIMAMPIFPVYEHHRFILSKSNIGLSDQFFIVDPIPISRIPQGFSK